MSAKADPNRVSLHLTPEQMRWLDNTARFLEHETGCEVSRRSVLMRLMEKGLPDFESELRHVRAAANRKAKRFSHLQLALTQPGL